MFLILIVYNDLHFSQLTRIIFSIVFCSIVLCSIVFCSIVLFIYEYKIHNFLRIIRITLNTIYFVKNISLLKLFLIRLSRYI